MPRLQVYLPDALYREVKARHLPASELLQAAVRDELCRQELLAETDAYLADLTVEAGRPSADDRARAQGLVEQITAQRTSRAG